jgi:16S rRNA (guanine527-N7)-methyltransferase
LVFEHELNDVLPADLPNREEMVRKGAAHLDLIVEANRHFNLTRIVSPREAAIKHVLDSVLPWRLFAESAHVLDAGTGAGFPGIPLALVMPETRFTLTDSTQKKARFVESAVASLALTNVTVEARRAEDLTAEVITARAMAPISRALDLFAPALKRGARLLLYKGPDVAREMEESGGAALKLRVQMKIVMTYELPEAMGTRTVVQIG